MKANAFRRDFGLVLCLLVALGGVWLSAYSSLAQVSNYPFPSYWSESGRIFNAYQVYDRLLAGEELGWPWLDPGRSILDGLALLVPGAQIWMYRLWVAVLYLATALAASYLVISAARHYAGRSPEGARLLTWTLVAWGFLFLFQGPVYYHLLIGVIPVLWVYPLKRPGLVSAAVLVGSAWEGLARVNWFLMPALVAATLYLLTEPVSGKSPWAYFKRTLKWAAVGGLASGASYWVSTYLSGQPSILDPVMRYGFNKAKLWPNSGFWPGLVPGISLVTLPVLLVVAYSVFQRLERYQPARLAALGAILAVLAAGGTLVSLRAGGGYDLHNYDALLLVAFLIGVFFGLGATVGDREIPPSVAPLERAGVVLGLLALPAFFAFQGLGTPTRHPEELIQEAIEQVAEITAGASEQGSVLFIEYRDLLIYGRIPPAQVFVPYEKIELMEMAMANHEGYFERFQQDIESRSFTYIVSPVLWDGQKDPSSGPYAHVNNVWSDYVAATILSHYAPVYVNEIIDLAVYAPK